MTSLAAVVLVATTGSATSTGPAALTGKDGSGTPPPTAADPRHVQVLVVGDSVAFTLGFSLTDGARYGVDVVNWGPAGLRYRSRRPGTNQVRGGGTQPGL